MKVENFAKRTLILLVMFVSVNTMYSQSKTILATKDYPDKEVLWQDFREKYPYQFQMVGLAEFDDNSKLLIISEPPSHVTETEIRKIFDGYSFDLSIKTQPIGYDGWVKDIVLMVNDPNKTKFASTLNQLQKYLYYTDYKAYTIPLPIQSKSENFLPYNTNLQISAAELQKWFMTDNEILISPNKIETNLNKSLNNSNSAGIYFSKKTGFVVWIVDVLEDLKDSKIEARKFALDADLILGAIARGKYVAIIGREREVPVNLLPPLRVETIMRLAATEHSELSQSYERTTLFAGQLYDENDERKDWAPILLSEELWHTEYGHLLNVTDQILKSWSENGNIEYEKFNYEKPFEWTFDSSAMKDLQVTQLTYNWNTSGVGYNILLENNDEIYAINRTGSLPVSYIPDGQEDNITKENKVYQAEETAYNWFSDLNNPDLVRVVQYAALYQIFQNFYVRYSGNYEQSKNNLDYLFKDIDIKLFKDIDIKSITKSYLDYLLKEYYPEKIQVTWKDILFKNISQNIDYDGNYKAFDFQQSFENTEKIQQKHSINTDNLEKDAYSLLSDIANYNKNGHRDSLKTALYEDTLSMLDLWLYSIIQEAKGHLIYQYLQPEFCKVDISDLVNFINGYPLNTKDKKLLDKAYKKFLKENKPIFLNKKTNTLAERLYAETFIEDLRWQNVITKRKEECKQEIDTDSFILQIDSLQQIFKYYQKTKLSTGENLLELLAKQSVNRNAVDYSKYDSSDTIAFKKLQPLNWNDVHYMQEYSNIFNLYPLLYVRNNYVKVNENNFSTWIKCPTIVQSWQLDNAGIGGHNLSAKTTPYRIDKTVKAGTYRVEKLENGTKRVFIGTAEDIKNITPKLLREVERTNVSGINKFETISTKITPRNEVIPAEIPKNPTNSIERGFITEKHLIPDVYEGNICLTTKTGETKTFASYEELQQFLVKENKSATIIIENVSANEAKANVTSAGVTQRAYYKRAEIGDNIVDCSRANYKIISENQIEVTFPLENKVNSNVKVIIKNTPIDKIKNYLKLGGKKTNKELMKDLNIKRDDIETILEIENGRTTENNFKYERFDEPIMFSTNAT